MVPLVARFAALMVAGRVFDRVARHPRVAPVVRSRKARWGVVLLGLALRRHPRTRVAGHALRHAGRLSRRAVKRAR